MLSALRVLLIALGLSAVAIALSIWLLGAEATARMSERVYAAATGRRGASEPWPATMDSELRFYAALWAAYGVVLVQTARAMPTALPRVPWLAAIFFAGGVGRAISWLQVGPPHPFFTVLMAIELGLPPILLALWAAARRA